MGCVQARPSPPSPPKGTPRKGLDKLKIDHGYVSAKHVRAPQPPPPARSSSDEDGRAVGRRMEEGNGASRSLLPMPASPKAAAEEGLTDEMVEGWPRWLVENVPREILSGLVPKSADNYDKIDKVGQGTYSNVYKARDRQTGKIVALKKVRFDTSEPESVKFMAREIMMLQRLDHPNIIKLEGLATSRMQYSLYLVFDFMLSDLTKVIARPGVRLTEAQVKRYMLQLLSGLQHCHERGLLHRDIKGANLLIDRNGVLKIADFGLANFYYQNRKRPLTSRVVTLWYRAPELLLGTADYGVGIDLWSAGCLLAEMFVGRPIMPGRTEVEQLHKIFKLCGTPSPEFWSKLRLQMTFRPPHPNKPTILEAFKDFPASSLGLLTKLLALDPAHRGSAASALQSEFFSTPPLACNLSDLPVIYKAEEHEVPQFRERRRRKSSKLKQRSRTQRGSHRKIQEAVIEEPDLVLSKQGEKTLDKQKKSEQSENSSGSPSSGVKPKDFDLSPPSAASPVLLLSKQKSSMTEAHPSATKNIKNFPQMLIPVSEYSSDEDAHRMWRYGMDKRSVSRLVFPRFDAEQKLI